MTNHLIPDASERAEFEAYMLNVKKCIVGSSDPYPAGIEREHWQTWQAARATQAGAKGAADDPDKLHFNAQRLRNVAGLVGVNLSTVNDETVDGARGAVLGEIAAKLRAAGAPAETLPECLGMLTVCPTCKNDVSKCVYGKGAPAETPKPVGYIDPMSLVNFNANISTNEWIWRDPDNRLIPVYITPAATIGAGEGNDAALRFADHIINGMFEGGDWDGGEVQELAVKYGLLAPQEMAAPCSEEGCQCAQNSAEFPTICYRKTYAAMRSKTSPGEAG